MPNTVWPPIRGKRIRITLLDVCGVPIIGPKSTLVADAFTRVEASPEFEDGEETAPKNANGKVHFTDNAPDQFKYLGLEIEFLQVDPEAFNMITGQPLKTNADGDAVGISVGSYDIEQAFALEVWTDVAGRACVGGLKPYGYYVYPFIANGRLGTVTVEQGSPTFTLSAKTKDGAAWGAGPYLVDRDEDGDLAVLADPLTDQDHMDAITVTVPPPAVTAGAVALAALPVTP